MINGSGYLTVLTIARFRNRLPGYNGGDMKAAFPAGNMAGENTMRGWQNAAPLDWAMFSGKYDGGFNGAPKVWQWPKPVPTGYMGLGDIFPGQKPKRQDYAGYPVGWNGEKTKIIEVDENV
ncbi:MAG: hypothetical protein DU429_05795 [Candidatus Tokpelaia sp.]|uniref:hypothetical protein n=1 Tax=Candidatus Tokpelaia sp. TaxID=2233777 RepID=UPI00123B6642|nr:hypothetical protein [Candidatus Tokpelaia sp.]KAA6204708.1 MAG: hypothetical protein DU430_07455 [Candidatus Tokpelaia sp.]KAA6206732.1 MAG: hypothetical protein DU429_05795 [Candidatus Tokpelaia sp.]KAA6405303.1 hypothetical protein DPQ22_05480 [Candidatus Tokpelaia sp.]